MISEMRQWAYRLENRRNNLKHLANVDAKKVLIEKAERSFQEAAQEFNRLADRLGLDEQAREVILSENEEFLNAKNYLSKLYPKMPTARIFKKILDFGRRWHFGGCDSSCDEQSVEKIRLINKMSFTELEAYLESNPDSEKAMHALSLMADQSLAWSQSILIEFILLAERARKSVNEGSGQKKFVQMVWSVIHQIEDELGED